MVGKTGIGDYSKAGASVAESGSRLFFRNFLKFDLEYLILIILIIVIIFGARVDAIQISAPDSVSIEENGQFIVDINNDSGDVVNISLAVYSPAKFEVKTPKILEPNSTAKALVLLRSNGFYGDYVGTIEVKSNEAVEKREFFLSIKQRNTASQNGSLEGFFSLDAFIDETSRFSLVEWGIFWVLVIVAAILLIAFIARVRKRV